MIPYELRHLIELALADGVLTDKEREIINARAEQINARAEQDEEEEGVDLDELSIYIDNELQKKQQDMKDGGNKAVTYLIDYVALDTSYNFKVREIAKFNLNAIENADALDRLLTYFKELVDAHKWRKDTDNDNDFNVVITSKYGECIKRALQLYPNDSRFTSRMSKDEFVSYVKKSRRDKVLIIGGLVFLIMWLLLFLFVWLCS